MTQQPTVKIFNPTPEQSEYLSSLGYDVRPVVIKEPKYINEIQPPRRTTFIGYHDCDFCGKCEKHGRTTIFHIEHLFGWLYCKCDHCVDLFEQSKDAFCKDLRDIFVTPDNIKVKRTSGAIDDGWYINQYMATRYSVNEPFIVKVENNGCFKNVTLDELLEINNLT